jgi:hypothetical protein
VSKEVSALREAVPAMNDGKDVRSIADFLAPVQMRVIGANDDTWTRANPNWEPVLLQISNDLRKDLEPALAEQNAMNAVRWNRELAAHLPAAQINDLLAFYHSDVGRRYLAFQKRLIAVQAEGSSALVGAMASGGSDPNRVVESTSAAQLELRKTLLAQSWLLQVTHAIGGAGASSHGANPGADKSIDDMVINMVAKLRGAELDALQHQYQNDLAAFSSFQDSPMAKALLAVYGHVKEDAAAEPVKPGVSLKAVLDQSVARHTPAWKAAYEAGRIDGH